MAPKRQRASTSYNSNRFVSLEAADRFDISIINQRKIIPERGFLLDEIIDLFKVPIIQRGWETFCKHPHEAREGVVREFYANAKEHVDGKIRVRGKLIKFNKSAINSFYKLGHMEEDNYSTINETVSLDTVTEYLYPNGTIWKCKSGTRTSFPSKDMHKRFKVWLYFFNAKVLPSTHFSDVTVDRAYLIYALDNELTIDVGKIIFEKIVAAAESETCSLYFPSLITALCYKAGVEMASDIILNPKEALGHNLTWSIYGKYAWADNVHGTSDLTTPSTSNQPALPPSSFARPRQASTSSLTTEARIERLEGEVNHLRTDMTHMRSDMTQWFTLMAEHLHIDPSRYPSQQHVDSDNIEADSDEEN